MKKILCICLTLIIALCCLVSCDNHETEIPEKHTCNTKCEYCSKCLNAQCEDDACKEKCTSVHTVAQFNSVFNLVGNIYYELLQFLYSDGTTTIYQARDGADVNSKSEYYGTWSKINNSYVIDITKRLPDGKQSSSDVVDYKYTYTTESGFGKQAVYYLDIITITVARQTMLYMTDTVTVVDVNAWLNDRYSNATPSPDELLKGQDLTKYEIDNVKPLENSPLSGKSICYLGSSVTYGSASNGVTFVEYIDKRNNSVSEKYAVSGTTLSSMQSNSYVERLQAIDTNKSFDIFVCQLSTNDSTSSNISLGAINKDGTPDTKTVCGAIEFIIKYVRETWDCPIVFYTNSYYESEKYSQMVDLLKEIAEEYDITVIDLYSDKEFNNLTIEQRYYYMADSIHPRNAGYLDWWTPRFEECLYELVK